MSSFVGCCGGVVGCDCCRDGAGLEGSNTMVRRSRRLVRGWNHVCSIDSYAGWTCRRWFFREKNGEDDGGRGGSCIPCGGRPGWCFSFVVVALFLNGYGVWVRRVFPACYRRRRSSWVGTAAMIQRWYGVTTTVKLERAGRYRNRRRPLFRPALKIFWLEERVPHFFVIQNAAKSTPPAKSSRSLFILFSIFFSVMNKVTKARNSVFCLNRA